jgi:hypothetical protein
LSKASEILQHFSDNWALHIKSQDVRYETTWMKGFGEEFLSPGALRLDVQKKRAFSDLGAA